MVHECVGLVDRRDGHPVAGHGKGSRGGRGVREYAGARGVDLPVREVARVVSRVGRDGDLIPGKEEAAPRAVDDGKIVQGTHGFDPQTRVSATGRVIDLVQARRGDADRRGDPLVPVLPSGVERCRGERSFAAVERQRAVGDGGEVASHIHGDAVRRVQRNASAADGRTFRLKAAFLLGAHFDVAIVGGEIGGGDTASDFAAGRNNRIVDRHVFRRVNSGGRLSLVGTRGVGHL